MRGATTRFGAISLALMVGFGVGRSMGNARAEGPYDGLEVFAQVLFDIGEHYVAPMPQRELVYRALDGVDDALDAHSRFMDPESLRRLREETEGQFVGIGAQMREDTCGLRITGLLAEGPAARSGLQPGDCLTTIDGQLLQGLGFDEAVVRVRGEEGQAALLGVLRDGVVRSVPVLRTRLVEQAVEGELFAPGLAWLHIRQFRAGTSADLASKVSQLGQSTPLSGAVLDLRGNPGGRLDEAVATVDLFVGVGRIVSTHGRGAAPDEVYDATPSRGDYTWPLVVLVDGQSASSAEIVAGALQDHKRARLVGSSTYGKGSVQSVFEYEDGSALKLTIARYHLPSGRTIEDHRGLLPDIPVAPLMLPGPVDLLRDRIRQLPVNEQADLLALVDRLPRESSPAPIDTRGTLLDRSKTDPGLAAALATLRAELR